MKTPIARVRVGRKCRLCYLPKEGIPAETALCLSCKSVLGKLPPNCQEFLQAWAHQNPIK